MSRFHFRFLPLLLLLVVGSCSTDLNPVIPQFADSESLLGAGKLIPKQSFGWMNGIYLVRNGSDQFGDTVVLRWGGNNPSIFCGKNSAFFILEARSLGDTIVFEGYWRYAYQQETGRARLFIAPNEGGSQISTGAGQPPGAITIRGASGGISGPLHHQILMERIRPIRQTIKNFWILGHRGGGRNSDLHPVSENSREMIQFAERLGCNGVEIDVRLTSDGVPILYHDEKLNTRLVRGDYMVGPVSNYAFWQLQRFTTLVNGEQIPSLEEALETAVTKTTLNFIWLDIKSPEVIPAIVPMVDSFRVKAAQLGRDIEIVMGLPEEAIYNAYRNLPEANRPPALCELSTQQANAINAAVWAPRWTLGTQDAAVAEMHSNNRRAFVWTLDNPIYILQFLREGGFDGILTNYPTMVAYMYYVKE
ncbi:MAG: glycerophosphodiester phosphodiesterase family protein [Armatimonadetes bacterium]|nr:glycerophosphodiester phosphodiesterase family protein [Armatimonadota bacterium]